MHKFLIVILGPTATGKTALAIDIAKAFGTEILSADSRQFFREMNIGTAKPSPQQLKEIRHHFINSLSVHNEYNVGEFEKDALAILEKIYSKNNIAVMAGGSGLYINAVCNGFDNVPQADKEIRKDLTARYKDKGIESLRIALKRLDPEHYEKIDLSNPHRLIRAIEVCMITGRKYSEIRSDSGTQETEGRRLRTGIREFKVIKVGLNVEREKLYERINARVDAMVDAGLLEEVKSLFPLRHLNSLNTVGYKELFEYMEGKTDFKSAVDRIKQNTRNFAKRQLTWFRKDKNIKWFSPGDPTPIMDFLKVKVK